MHRKDAAPDRHTQIDRVAWLVTFVVPLVLTALLLGAKAAQAAEPLPPVPLAFEEVFEVETVEVSELEPEEACFEAEEAFEMEELAEAEMEEICEEEAWEPAPEAKGQSDEGSPAECPLRSANAHATTKHDKLRLTIGYTTSEPVDATVEIKQGSTRLASLQRHLGRSGVLRYTKQLDDQQNGKLTVRIKLAAGAAGCPSRRLVLFPR